MKKSYAQHSVFGFGLMVAALFVAFQMQANPIPLPEKPVASEISFLIPVSILLEAFGWLFLLRRFQKPSFLILWILGMHLITFPAFLGLLKFLDTMRPATAVALGETSVVLVEGYLVFLICNYVRPSRQNASPPSLLRCWLVSLAGNICSAVAFPLLAHAHDSIFSY
jgi:hypothetical protein